MNNSYKNVSEYDAVRKVIQVYLDAGKSGDGAKMSSAFYEDAIMHGYIGSDFVGGPVKILFDWTSNNAGGEPLQARIVSIDIADTIASVRVEIENWVGFNFTDILSLLKSNGQWKISSKIYHTHS